MIGCSSDILKLRAIEYSIEYDKTKTKVITTTHQSERQMSKEPIITQG